MSAGAGSKRIAAVSLAIATSVAFACSSDSTKPVTPSGPDFSAPLPIEAGQVIGAPTYAAGDSSAGGQGAPVDGIACDTTTPVQHIHVHLTLIANGQQRAIPIAIGVGDPFIIQNLSSRRVATMGCTPMTPPGSFTSKRRSPPPSTSASSSRSGDSR